MPVHLHGAFPERCPDPRACSAATTQPVPPVQRAAGPRGPARAPNLLPDLATLLGRFVQQALLRDPCAQAGILMLVCRQQAAGPATRSWPPTSLAAPAPTAAPALQLQLASPVTSRSQESS